MVLITAHLEMPSDQSDSGTSAAARSGSATLARHAAPAVSASPRPFQQRSFATHFRDSGTGLSENLIALWNIKPLLSTTAIAPRRT